MVVDEDGRILSNLEEIGGHNKDGIVFTKKIDKHIIRFARTCVPKELWHRIQYDPYLFNE